MLRWICGHTRNNEIRNEDIWDKMEVASVVDKTREARLRWFGRVRRRQVDTSVRRCERLDIQGTMRSSGRMEKLLSRADQTRHGATAAYRVYDLKRVWRLWIRVEGQQIVECCLSQYQPYFCSVLLLFSIIICCLLCFTYRTILLY